MRRVAILKCSTCKKAVASYPDKPAGKYFSKREGHWLLLCGICRHNLTKSLIGNAGADHEADTIE